MDAPRYTIGCTGWGYDDWKGGFYPRGTPPGEYLQRYARVFRATEVDSSYYAAPARSVVARWAATTPPGFTFSMKLPGSITHEAKLRGVDRAVEFLLEAVDPLRRASKLGPLVAQMPASFTRGRDEEALLAFLRDWPKEYRLAVELRDPSWWHDATYRALSEANAALVWNYTQYGRAPPVATADFLYARLIGDRALTKFDRVQRDHTDEMRFWRQRFENEGRHVAERIVMLNNHLMGHAPVTALRMHEVLGLPLPDLAAASRDAGQRSLGDLLG